MPTQKDVANEAEIEAARKQTFETGRATVPALEEMLFKQIAVLDNGFIRVVDYMGDDTAIVQAARVSYGRGTRKVSEDRGLIRYLMRHQHTTPFEMPVIKLHVKLPIFVARQWIRHRMASVNEYSARYSVLDREFYVPAPEQLALQSTTNRQGRGAPLNSEEAKEIIEILVSDANRNYENYSWMLNEDENGQPVDPNRRGLSRELARMNLTLNTYTQWYWKIDLHNLFNFLKLRADPHAQYEIRVYAEEILKVVEKWVPTAYEAFLEYRLGAISISKTATEVLRILLSGGDAAEQISQMSDREWQELQQQFNIVSGAS